MTNIEHENYNFNSELIISSIARNQITSIYKAISPETTVDINLRATANIYLIDDNTLKMTFHALDFISLRAILGSYLRWIEVIINSLEVVDL